MTLTVVDHPLAAHLLAALRDETTPPAVFRVLAKRLALLLVLEATRELPTRPVEVRTPLASAAGLELRHDLVAVPILRAGLGMLEAVTELFPEVAVGYVGLERDEQTLRPKAYYEKLPPVRDRHVLLLDPMLATGGSAAAACDSIAPHDPARIRFASVVAAPEGVARLEADHPEVEIVTAALDERLNDVGYIVPGLGDFGDRLYGTEPR